MAQFLIVATVGNSDSDVGDLETTDLLANLNSRMEMMILVRHWDSGMWKYDAMPVTFSPVSEVANV